MNFHKTIGFLATLLLVFGLGVPDSFAQEVKSVTLSGVSPTTLRDSTTADVKVRYTLGVTLKNNAAADTTVNVSVGFVDATADDDDSFTLTGATGVTVTVKEGSSTGSLSIRSTDSNALSFDFTDGPPKGDADTDDETVNIWATVAATDHIGTADVESNKVKLTVTDHEASLTDDAISVQGFKVRITAPGKDKWASTGKDKIKVRLFRKGNIAKEFGTFSSITVALHDDTNKDGKAPTTEDPDPILYSMTLDNNVRLSTLAVPRVRTKTLASDNITGTTGSLNEGNTKAYYTRRSSSNGYDVLEFRFHPTATTAVRGEYVYAVVTFGLTSPPAGTPNTIESRDTKTSIFDHADYANEKVGDGVHIKIDAAAPSATVVSAIAVTIDGDVVPAGGNTDDTLPYAGIGDKIKISADIANFTDKTLVFQIIAPIARSFVSADEATTVQVTGANQPLNGYSKSFDNLAVLGFTSSNKPVTDEITVTANKFKRKANLKAHPDDLFKKNGTYEDDRVVVRVRAQVKDSAGNSTNQTTAISQPFFLDSRPPKITVEYPKPSVADSARFTEMATQNVADVVSIFNLADAKLKPLRFKSDEIIDHVVEPTADGVDSLFVIIGAGASVDTLLGPAQVGADGTADAGFLTLGPADGSADVSYDLSVFEQVNAVNKKGTNKKNAVADAGQGGKEVDVTIVTKDRAGNKGMTSFKAIFDGTPPKVENLFPNNDALKDYGNKIGDGTQHPIFSINEATDSILVRYAGDSGDHDVPGTAAQKKMVNKNIKVMFTGKNDSLRQDSVYDLQVYAKDLAGNVGVSDVQRDLVFDNAVNNPEAGGFKVSGMDSVVAGQPLALTVTALDTMLTRQAKKDRPAVTYAKAGVMVVAMGSDGNMASDAKFYGKGVTDNKDGSATLGSAEWSIGVHKVNVILKNADDVTIVAKDMTAAGVLNFSGETMVTVDAADFAMFDITALENGVEAKEVWGDFTLTVTPADRYGNPSVKVYKPVIGDSLDVLDTRVKTKAGTATDTIGYNYKNGFDITLRSLPDIGLPPFEWTIELDDAFTRTFAVTAPSTAKQVAIQVRVDNTSLIEGDTRSANVKTNMTIKVVAPLTPVLSLWVPDNDTDQAGNDVVVPADGITVTVTVDGFKANSDVTFTKDGTAMDAVKADDNGTANLDIAMSGAGTVMVSAMSGQYSTDTLTINFVEKASRVSYVDADGKPVYLIAKTSGKVGIEDFLALVAAYGTSEGDDKYNVQADIDGDGDVDIDDFLAFIDSYGRTAVGPATKPLVLLPGINENAEFALSLGSERVVAGELVAVDVSLANVEAVVGYGFALNYEADKFEFVSVAPADEDLLTSTGGETLFHHVVADGQITVATGMYNGTAVSGGGDVVQFVFRVLREFEDNARFEIADGLVFDPSQLQNPAVVAGVLELQSTPREFALHQNFPNPFNPDTTIKYDLAESADVTLQIYNVLGQVVRTLVASEAQNAGRYQIRWNGMDDRGVPVSSGVYFFQISAEGKFHDVRKLMLLK